MQYLYLPPSRSLWLGTPFGALKASHACLPAVLSFSVLQPLRKKPRA